jgi:hypothetical protein
MLWEMAGHHEEIPTKQKTSKGMAEIGEVEMIWQPKKRRSS